MVRMPSVPPYSSTTTAMAVWLFFSSAKTLRHLVCSGTYSTGRITSPTETPPESCRPTRHSRSLTWMNPRMLSRSFSYTGSRENPSAAASSATSLIFASFSTAAISVRWVMMSPAVVSSNSKMLLIISFWLSSMKPISLPVSTSIRISSSVTVSAVFLGSAPSTLATPAENPRMGPVMGIKSHSAPGYSFAAAYPKCSQYRAPRNWGIFTPTLR